MINISTVVSKFLMGSFSQNTYVLQNESEVIIIDAGAEVEDLKEIIQEKKVLAVLITHLHFDHIWNLQKILEKFNCPVYIKENCENNFLDSSFNASYLIRMNLTFDIPKNKIKFYEEDLTLGKFEFKVFYTPGHSRDCVCLKIEDVLFTGDTIFKDSIGRTDLIDSDKINMISSLEKINDIDFKIAYPGHYESCTKQEVMDTIDMFL